MPANFVIYTSNTLTVDVDGNIVQTGFVTVTAFSWSDADIETAKSIIKDLMQKRDELSKKGFNLPEVEEVVGPENWRRLKL